ncbi:MAG: hypothetical protein AAGF83_12425 [Cyanobacteria bacterium P01_G01_bin.67]
MVHFNRERIPENPFDLTQSKDQMQLFRNVSSELADKVEKAITQTTPPQLAKV